MEDDIILLSEVSDSEFSEINKQNHTTAWRSGVLKIISIIVASLLKFRVVYNISDQAIVLLLRFFKFLLFMIGTAFQVQELKQDTALPQSIRGCYTLLNINSTPYKEYVVCPACHLLYDQSTFKLVQGTTQNPISARCTFVEFPNHSQRRFRQACNTALMLQVRTKYNKVTYRARKLYYYYGLKSALSILVSRTGFLRLCNLWHQNSHSSWDFLTDITDGSLWRELITSMTLPNTRPINILGLLVNIDWFQPFKHLSYSVGVIYAVLVNLPRKIRYLPENVIITGIIPGPHEPKKHINTYLGPFVNELLEMYQGVWLETSIGKQYIKCVVIGLSSDIPATLKAAGFVGHIAKKACSRCLKDFPRINDHTDCSGYEREKWPPRTHETHCKQAQNGLTAQTKSERKAIESEYGARYSVMFELPYYNAICFAGIDVMHNLFLGTAKTIACIWKEKQILTKKDFDDIQCKITKRNAPIDIGRIPHKIEIGMSVLTADQLKTWTCLYSVYVLSDVLPKEHLDCWWLFVQACSLICRPLLTSTTIERADRYIHEFCQTVEKLYGQESCTINMHLHCHLADFLKDYGPVHSTWCFSFERFNGILGSMPNNHHTLHIEKNNDESIYSKHGIIYFIPTSN